MNKLILFPSICMDNIKHEHVYVHTWSENGAQMGFICTMEFQVLAYLEGVYLMETGVKTMESVLEQQTRPLPDMWKETWVEIPGPLSRIVQLNSSVSFSSPEWHARQIAYEMCCQLELLATFYIIQTSLKLGWKPQVSEKITSTDSFCQQLGIMPAFQSHVYNYFTAFEVHGLLK